MSFQERYYDGDVDYFGDEVEPDDETIEPRDFLDCECVDEEDFQVKSAEWCPSCRHYDGCDETRFCEEVRHSGCDNCRESIMPDSVCGSCKHFSSDCLDCEDEFHSN